MQRSLKEIVSLGIGTLGLAGMIYGVSIFAPTENEETHLRNMTIGWDAIS